MPTLFNNFIRSTAPFALTIETTVFFKQILHKKPPRKKMAKAGSIKLFINEFEFLSNGYSVKIVFDGIEFPSVEHAYLASKIDDPELRQKIEKTENHVKAKILVRKFPDKNNKITTMKTLLQQKFSVPELKDLLKNTKTLNLVNGNYYGDNVWGCILQHKKWQGQNLLGNLLMELRKTLN